MRSDLYFRLCIVWQALFHKDVVCYSFTKDMTEGHLYTVTRRAKVDKIAEEFVKVIEKGL